MTFSEAEIFCMPAADISGIWNERLAFSKFHYEMQQLLNLANGKSESIWIGVDDRDKDGNWTDSLGIF